MSTTTDSLRKYWCAKKRALGEPSLTIILFSRGKCLLRMSDETFLGGKGGGSSLLSSVLGVKILGFCY